MAELISIADALDTLCDHVGPLPGISLPLDKALGHVLAEDICCRVDSPPYDKASMDGYAVRDTDVSEAPVTLRVIEEVMAGQVPSTPVVRGTATRIMTGAPMPDGANTVVPVEQTELARGTAPGDAQVTIMPGDWSAGRHVLRQGELMHAGDIILRAGRRIRPIDVGLLAELGSAHVPVHPMPTIAIVATGDELVEPGQPLGPSQIWNSNGPLLAALVQQLGATAAPFGIVPDDTQRLAEAIAAGLRHNVLVLTGGVSMGARDFVPELLREAGVECLFHKVSMKPGKPVWCGVRSARDGSTVVFGLPGNPVSTFVCFELFVRTAIGLLAGKRPSVKSRQGRLASMFVQRGDRPTLFPGHYVSGPAGPDMVTPLPWKGSADLRTVTEANCLIEFPAGDCQFEAGHQVSFRPLSE